ncbi:MAG TPA: hypothetical protein VFA39_11365 [Steroidobacteraceae bacterium]|nr:hypothetical protein [Steroidobacteraceae bacterium]
MRATLIAQPHGIAEALFGCGIRRPAAARLVAQARGFGPAALTARPEHLDRAVFEAYREHRQRRRV